MAEDLETNEQQETGKENHAGEPVAPTSQAQERLAAEIVADFLSSDADSFEEEPKLEFQILDNPEQRRMLMKRVDDLATKLNKDHIANVVYLDKSARPISVLCRDLQKMKFPDAKPPETNFLNVGTETTSHVIQSLEKKGYYIREPTRFGDEDYKYLMEILDSLKPDEVLSNFPEEAKRIRNEYSYLKFAPKGTKVLIVDEYSQTGMSLALAKKLLSSIFQDLNFEEFIFTHQYKKDGSVNPLFLDSKSGKYNPPWRSVAGEEFYKLGIMGVSDPEGIKLTAIPTRDFDFSKKSAKLAEPWESEINRVRESIPKLAQMDVESLFAVNLPGQPARLSAMLAEKIKNLFERARYDLTKIKEAAFQIPADADINYYLNDFKYEYLTELGQSFFDSLGYSSEVSRFAFKHIKDEVAHLLKKFGDGDYEVMMRQVESIHQIIYMRLKGVPIVTYNPKSLKYVEKERQKWLHEAERNPSEVKQEKQRLIKQLREELHATVLEFWQSGEAKK